MNLKSHTPRINLNNNVLTILRTKIDDSGRYNCETTNILKTKFNVLIIDLNKTNSSNIDYRKLRAPKLIKENPIHRTISRHTKLELMCLVNDGYPTPSIKWYFNN